MCRGDNGDCSFIPLLREGRTTEVQKLRHMTGWGFWLRVETVLGLFSTELNGHEATSY